MPGSNPANPASGNSTSIADLNRSTGAIDQSQHAVQTKPIVTYTRVHPSAKKSQFDQFVNKPAGPRQPTAQEIKDKAARDKKLQSQKDLKTNKALVDSAVANQDTQVGANLSRSLALVEASRPPVVKSTLHPAAQIGIGAGLLWLLFLL